MAKVETETKEVVKKTRSRKPKKVEVVEAIVDDVKVVDEVKTEEIAPKKTYRELRSELRKLKNDLEVEIINLNSCTTSCRDRHDRILFKLENTGDREYLTLGDLFEVANKYKGLFKKHLIAIIDVDSDDYTIEDILTYLNLEEIYQDNGIENYDTDYVGQILKMDVRKFERFIEESSIELVKIVASRAVELYRQKKFDSRIKEQALATRLGREDLFEI